jgi:hypothetical protein
MHMVKAYKLWKITYVQVTANTYDLSKPCVNKIKFIHVFEADHNLPSAQVSDQSWLSLAPALDYLTLVSIPTSRCQGHHLTENHSTLQH